MLTRVGPTGQSPPSNRLGDPGWALSLGAACENRVPDLLKAHAPLPAGPCPQSDPQQLIPGGIDVDAPCATIRKACGSQCCDFYRRIASISGCCDGRTRAVAGRNGQLFTKRIGCSDREQARTGSIGSTSVGESLR